MQNPNQSSLFHNENSYDKYDSANDDIFMSGNKPANFDTEMKQQSITVYNTNLNPIESPIKHSNYQMKDSETPTYENNQQDKYGGVRVQIGQITNSQYSSNNLLENAMGTMTHEFVDQNIKAENIDKNKNQSMHTVSDFMQTQITQVKQSPQGINLNGNPTVSLKSPKFPPQSDLWDDNYKGPNGGKNLNNNKHQTQHIQNVLKDHTQDEDTNFDQYSALKQTRRFQGTTGPIGQLQSTGLLANRDHKITGFKEVVDGEESQMPLLESEGPVNLGLNTQRDSQGVIGLPNDFGILESSYQGQTTNYNNSYGQDQNMTINQNKYDVHASSNGIRHSDQTVGDQIARINAQNTIHANSPHSNASFVSKIPKVGGVRIPRYPQNSSQNYSSHKRSQNSVSIGKQEDAFKLHSSNIQLRDTVLMVVQKLENFIEKTKIVKETKHQLNMGGKPPENEIFTAKQQELDSYLMNIKESKRAIKKMRAELDQDSNFKRMIESENMAKEQYRKLQQLLDENMQLKKIHGGQEAVLDTSQQQKAKREDIRIVKEQIQALNQRLRQTGQKQRERETKIKEKHDQIIEYRDRCRDMNEVLRLKKIEEKNEIDEQIKLGYLDVGSPKRKNQLSNEMSEIGFGIGPMSARNGAISLNNISSKDSILHQLSPGGKVRHEDIEKLEKKCQRMIFEKEDKYVANEDKLKVQDEDLTDLELEVKQMELRLKEKSQESNLLDFKLRDMARNNDTELGFLKPHSGIHSGILSGHAGAALGPTISLMNKHGQKSIGTSRDIREKYASVNQSMDAMRVNSKQSRRSISKYSIASKDSRFDDQTVSMSAKRKQNILPKLNFNRKDTNYINLMNENLKVPSVAGSKKSQISKSAVNSNAPQSKLPSHLRGGNYYLRSQVVISPNFQSARKRNKLDAVNRSVNITSNKGQSLLSGRNKKLVDGLSTNNSIERANVSVGLNSKLKKYGANTAQKNIRGTGPGQYGQDTLQVPRRGQQTNQSMNLPQGLSKNFNTIGDYGSPPRANESFNQDIGDMDLNINDGQKTLEMRRREADQAILQTANIKN